MGTKYTPKNTSTRIKRSFVKSPALSGVPDFRTSPFASVDAASEREHFKWELYRCDEREVETRHKTHNEAQKTQK